MPSRHIGRWLAASLLGCLGFQAPGMAQSASGWTEAQQAKRIEQYRSLTAADVAKTVLVTDDELEPAAILSTERAYRFKGGFSDRVRADNFLRAVIDKSSGEVIYQVYQRPSYSGERRDLEAANYQLNGKPTSVPLTIADHQLRCEYGTCFHNEVVAFDLSGMAIESIASRADVPAVVSWRYRLKARSGEDWTDDIAPAEAAGLLLAVARREAPDAPSR